MQRQRKLSNLRKKKEDREHNNNVRAERLKSVSVSGVQLTSDGRFLSTTSVFFTVHYLIFTLLFILRQLKNMQGDKKHKKKKKSKKSTSSKHRRRRSSSL
jgi:hypothetical protein